MKAGANIMKEKASENKKIIPEKKVCAVHDVSCTGRCSLTVILPVLSAAGIECSVIPTAVLSTHTGEFTNYTFRNLSEDILPIAEHWMRLGREYDAIYTGYFGSVKEIEAAGKLQSLIGKCGPDGEKDLLLMVDPVLGDAGKLYSGFDMEFVEAMRDYCRKADIIIPNVTEAQMLLGEECSDGPFTDDTIKKMLERLTETGPKCAVITGITSESGKSGAAYYDSQTGEFGTVMKKTVPGRYYGTGDLFGSALLAGLLNGKSLKESLEKSLDFVYRSILRTYKLGTDARYGVEFEHYLAGFGARIK